MPEFNVIVATPTAGTVKSDYAYSLARLTAYFAQTSVYPESGASQMMDFAIVEGSGISSNREQIVKQSLELPGITHILFLDDDMGFDMDILHVLAARRQPIVGCNYRMRQPPADFTALALDKKSRVQTTAQSIGLQEATYIGFGVTLIDVAVFRAMKQPYFPLQFSPEMSMYTTEDNTFFAQARTLGFKVYVDHDASKKCWHYGSIRYKWDKSYKEL